MSGRETGQVLILLKLFNGSGEGLRMLSENSKPTEGALKTYRTIQFSMSSRVLPPEKAFLFSTAIYRNLARLAARTGPKGTTGTKATKERTANFRAGSPSGGQKVRGADFYLLRPLRP